MIFNKKLFFLIAIIIVMLIISGIGIYIQYKIIKSKTKFSKIYKKIVFFPFSLFW
jgi:hypothetical protein